MKRELLFFSAGIILTAATVAGVIFGISFLTESMKNILSASASTTTVTTRFNIEGLKAIGVLPQ